MTTRAYPDGIDYVWLASDRNGRVGAFVTAGIGPIPAPALSDALLPIEDVEVLVCELPKVSECRLLVEMKRPDDFVAMAQRGLFVYDWSDVHRTKRELTHAYELIAVPLIPIASDALPEAIKGLAEAVNLRNVAFAEEQALDIRTCGVPLITAQEVG